MYDARVQNWTSNIFRRKAVQNISSVVFDIYLYCLPTISRSLSVPPRYRYRRRYCGINCILASYHRWEYNITSSLFFDRHKETRLSSKAIARYIYLKRRKHGITKELSFLSVGPIWTTLAFLLRWQLCVYIRTQGAGKNIAMDSLSLKTNGDTRM